jgi:hypothetical protein
MVITIRKSQLMEKIVILSLSEALSKYGVYPSLSLYLLLEVSSSAM